MEPKQSKEEYASPMVIKHDTLKEMTGFQRYHNHSYGDKSDGYTSFKRSWFNRWR